MDKTIAALSLLLLVCACLPQKQGAEIMLDFGNPVNINIIANGVQWSAYPHADTDDAEWGALMTPEKWKRVYHRLDYLKPGIIRVMDQAGWRYLKGVDELNNPIINFHSDEVKALLNVLDYCQQNNILVVFGEWGAPGFWSEPGNINRADDPRWIHMITRYLDFLINEKGYTCIRYYNLVNEPNGNWASTNGDWEQWKKGVLMLHDSIRTIGLGEHLRIAGPDAVVVYDNPASPYAGWQWVDETISQLDSVIGIYDIHAYPDGKTVNSGDFSTYYAQISEKVRATGKKLLLGELGLKYSGDLYSKNLELAKADPNAGEYDSNMFVYEFFYGLDVADALIQAMNNRMEGAIAWDLDDAMHTVNDTGDKTKLKRWGMWNSLGTELCNNPDDENLRPWFYTWSLLCRYFPTGSTIARVTVPGNCPLRVVAGALDDQASVAILNNSEQEQTMYLCGEKMPKGKEWNQYLFSETVRPVNADGFPVPAEKRTTKLSGLQLSVPAKSFILLTSFEN